MQNEKNRWGGNKKIHGWKWDFIAISKESSSEKINLETKKLDQLLPNIPASKILELMELFYAGAKLVLDKINVPQRNRYTKPGGEIKIEERVKKLWQQAKVQMKEKHERMKRQKKSRGCPRGLMVKAMDCGIVVREFVLQSRYNVHFRANTLGKSMNPLILPAMG